MTADKVTLRMNAVVTYRIVDARQAVTVSDARVAVPRGACSACGRRHAISIRSSRRRMP
jgi:regulator of protease activity HflC (stomatin/prohibitin superfamily)